MFVMRAKASVTAGFIRLPPYFWNTQTTDVTASHVLKVALNSRESDVLGGPSMTTSLVTSSKLLYQSTAV